MFFGSSTSFYASAKLSAAEAITGHHVPLTCANIGIFLLSTNNDWKRPIRRPSHTWLRAIEADFGLATAWRKATSRDEWRHIVDTAMLQWSTL